MNWEQFQQEGERVVRGIREGLQKRNINAGEPIITPFQTDEDIPIYDKIGNKLFWISVKTVSGKIRDPIAQMPSNYKGWMCGEVESKQWVNPPELIIWYCIKTSLAWGAIVPKRPSTQWIIFPDRYGVIIDKRKTMLTGETYYLYPSYCVPSNQIITKEKLIAYIKKRLHDN